MSVGTTRERVSRWVPNVMPAKLNAPDTAIFNVSDEGLLNLGAQLSNILTGNVTLTQGGSNTTFWGQSRELVDVFWGASSSLANLTALVQDIADSMTPQIRTADVANANSYYAPTMIAPVTVVRVRWLWLAYSLALVLAGLLVLALTMYSTSRRKVRPWKGHRIPLLLADIDDTLCARAQGRLGCRTGLDDRLGAVRVRLEFEWH